MFRLSLAYAVLLLPRAESFQNSASSLLTVRSHPTRIATYRFDPRLGAAIPSSNHRSQYDPDSSLSRKRHREASILRSKKNYKVASLFGLWYGLSILYNIFSKRALIMAPELSWTAAWFQMFLGLFYVLPLWLSPFRRPPQLSRPEIRALLPVAFLHSLVHIGGVVSMGAGAVSFTYIVKASEPAVSAVLSAAVLKEFLPFAVYLTLIPVMGGVALSSVSELSFTWKSFSYAMMSNLASASRGIVGKKTIGKRLGKNWTAANMYTVLTILASILLLPATCVMEGTLWKSSWSRLVSSSQAKAYALQMILASFCYYTYNEVSFLCLKEVSPISHAIGKCTPPR